VLRLANLEQEPQKPKFWTFRRKGSTYRIYGLPDKEKAREVLDRYLKSPMNKEVEVENRKQ